LSLLKTNNRLVLAVISGELTVAEAARRGLASEQSISTWKATIPSKAARPGLSSSGPVTPSQRERALADENEELKAALGEAHVELRVWKKSAEHRWGLRGGRGDPPRVRDANQPLHQVERGA
jgi:transposase